MKKLFSIDAQQSADAIEIKTLSNNDIAIIGIGTRLPLSDHAAEFWERLTTGTDFVRELSPKRQDDMRRYMRAKQIDEQATAFFEAAYLDDISGFDYHFFELSHKEAQLMDPHHRVFLESVWHAIEDAGYAGGQLEGTRTGVFVGHSNDATYYQWIKDSEPEAEILAAPGNTPSILASRIAYMLNLKGPSLMMDTACSSSLVAVHAACQAIHNKECDMAIVGGVKVIIDPIAWKGREKAEILSSSGRAKTFNEDSDGTGLGEGAISLILKPLAKALQEGDQIYASIKGSAVNQDGRSIGITAPNVLAQKEVIQQAWEQAEIAPDSIRYIEAHGTGTKLGDPIEIEGITRAFREYTGKKQFCAVGSIKTNLGHLDHAAGIAGLLKVILTLKYKQFAPHIHFERPNSQIPFHDSPVYISQQTEWEQDRVAPRRAGVSSFGISGTNCHMILEEAPARNPSRGQGHSKHILTLSANSQAALLMQVRHYEQHLSANAGMNVVHLCYTASIGRKHRDYRVAIVGQSIEEFVRLLRQLADRLTQSGEASFSDHPFYYAYHKKIAKPRPARRESEITKEECEQLTEQANQSISEYVDHQREEALYDLCHSYVQGAFVSWQALYRKEKPFKISLPLYPYERKECWLDFANVHSDSWVRPQEAEREQEQREFSQHEMEPSSILSAVQQMLMRLYEIEVDDIAEDTDFFELGIDSISIMQLKTEVVRLFQIDIPVGKFFDLITTPQELAHYIEQERAANIDVKEVGAGADASVSRSEPELLSIKPSTPESAKGSGIILDKFIVKADKHLTEQQQRYLHHLSERYVSKTKTSKAYTQQYRPVWANDRAVQGFTPAWKEMVYPLFAEEGQGSKMRDVDGNEYIDFCMGFGVFLLGYSHPDVAQAIESKVRNQLMLGPSVTTTGEVSELIRELTGVERVAFFNSGTEAVMVAVRMARATTGRSKLVLFSGSYHGTFDGVYARQDSTDPGMRSIPTSLGTPQSFADEVVVLDYASPQSLAYIQQHAHELAAVLVEPVQSRRPDLQPGDYLRELRKITAESGIALIFDEMITGFRIHPGGAQAYFNIKADLVTYGKIAGGGLPIGIVAGKAAFMDRIDGGQWQYGDASTPNLFMIQSAGTFCYHPLTMQASKTVLTYIQEQRDELYPRLNAKAERLADYLNDYFETIGLPLAIVHFGSQFLFKPKDQEQASLLRFLYYQLIHRGIYLWEGGTFFLSAAHTDEDIARLVKAMKDSCYELAVEGGFSLNSAFLSADNPLETDWLQPSEQGKRFALSEEQKRIYLLTEIHREASAAYHESICLPLKGEIRIELLKQAVHIVIQRHEALRLYNIDGVSQSVQAQVKIDIPLYSAPEEAEKEQSLWTLMEEELHRGFDFKKGPLLRASLFKLEEKKHLLYVVAHHIMMDGWSFQILMQEVLDIYQSLAVGAVPRLAAPTQFSQYIAWLEDRQRSADGQQAQRYWLQQFAEPVDPLRLGMNPFQLNRRKEMTKVKEFDLDAAQTKMLKQFGKQSGCSVFMVLLSVYKAFLYKITRQSRLVVGIPFSGQVFMEAELLMGQCVHMLPVYSVVKGEDSFEQLLKQIKEKLRLVSRNRDISFAAMIERASEQQLPCFLPEIKAVFNMDRAIDQVPEHANMQIDDDFLLEVKQMGKYDLFLDVVEYKDRLHLKFQYDPVQIREEIFALWLDYFMQVMANSVKTPSSSLDELDISAQACNKVEMGGSHAST